MSASAGSGSGARPLASVPLVRVGAGVEGAAAAGGGADGAVVGGVGGAASGTTGATAVGPGGGALVPEVLWVGCGTAGTVAGDNGAVAIGGCGADGTGIADGGTVPATGSPAASPVREGSTGAAIAKAPMTISAELFADLRRRRQGGR
jgi:hypothetical protein